MTKVKKLTRAQLETRIVDLVAATGILIDTLEAVSAALVDGKNKLDTYLDTAQKAQNKND
jgi:hypothetical protein